MSGSQIVYANASKIARYNKSTRIIHIDAAESVASVSGTGSSRPRRTEAHLEEPRLANVTSTAESLTTRRRVSWYLIGSPLAADCLRHWHAVAVSEDAAFSLASVTSSLRPRSTAPFLQGVAIPARASSVEGEACETAQGFAAPLVACAPALCHLARSMCMSLMQRVEFSKYRYIWSQRKEPV